MIMFWVEQGKKRNENRRHIIIIVIIIIYQDSINFYMVFIYFPDASHIDDVVCGEEEASFLIWKISTSSS